MRPVLAPVLAGALLALAAGALPCDEQHQKRAQTSAVASTGLTDGAAQAVVDIQRRVRRQATNSTATWKRPTSSEKKRKKNENNKNKGDKRELDECLAAHNKWRRLHNVPELEWDEKLAAFAQKRSNHIAASDGKEFGHPPDLPFGENLFWHSSLETGCEYMVKGWYDEIDLYDFKAPSFAPATGHFTQMVWRGTRRVGCAFAPSGGPRGGRYLTCNYDPPGNWLGEFDDNVPKPSTWAQATSAAPKAAGGARGLATPPTSPVASTTPAASPATTTKPKSNKKTKKKKKKSKKDKKGDKDKKKKRKGRKKKKTTPTPTTSAPYNATISAS